MSSDEAVYTDKTIKQLKHGIKETMDSVENVRQGDVKSLALAEREAENEDDYKKKKYITLFKARTILAKIGTTPERQLCRKQLKRMKRDGIKSI